MNDKTHERIEPYLDDPAPAPTSDATPATVDEPDAPAQAETPAPAKDALAEAQARIAALEAEIAQLKDQTLRTLAEAENARRRLRKDADETAKYAIANFARELLAAPDNLRRALDAIPPEGRKADELLDRLASGVELVERDLAATFERAGIRRVDPLGQPFDHNLHQAIFEVPTAEKPPGTVMQVVAPGYVIHERLLRPAMVGVAKAPAAEKVEGGEATMKPAGSQH
ncbi:MAG TPA: nucleotide exchange factor GrpE [Alphaproteobacteria bacterium]|nr:nucleotide exchange factor GrpE [Alphaproteobacteria bacterium]